MQALVVLVSREVRMMLLHKCGASVPRVDGWVRQRRQLQADRSMVVDAGRSEQRLHGTSWCWGALLWMFHTSTGQQVTVGETC